MFLINTVLWYGVWFLNVHASHKALKPPRRSRKLIPGRNNADRKREIRLIVEGWVVWTVFIFAEGLTDRTVYYLLPFYSEIKSAFMIYLILSRTIGTHAIYIHLILPAIHQFSHPFEMFFSLIYVLTEALIGLVPLSLTSFLRLSSDRHTSSSPLKERLSIVEGKSQARKIVQEIHEMQGMVRPLYRQGSYHDGQTRVVGVRKRKGGISMAPRPSIPKNEQPAGGHIHLENAPSSMQSHFQIPVHPTISVPPTTQFVSEPKKQILVPRSSSATLNSPAPNQVSHIYPSLLLKSSPQAIIKSVPADMSASKDVSSAILPSTSPSDPSVPSSASLNPWTFTPLRPQQGSSSAIPDTLLLPSNNGASSFPLALPVSKHEPPFAQQSLRATPSRKAKLNRIQTELSQTSPSRLSLLSSIEAKSYKRRRVTQVVDDTEPSPRRNNVERLEDGEIENKSLKTPEEYYPKRMEGSSQSGIDDGLSGRKKRGGVVRTKEKALKCTNEMVEEMEVESSLQGGDIKRYLPSVHSVVHPATQQRPKSTASDKKSTRFAPYSRRNVPSLSEPTTATVASRRAAPATVLATSQTTSSTHNSVASKSRQVKTDIRSSQKIQPIVSSKVSEAPVSSTAAIRKNARTLPTRSSTRSKTTTSTSDAGSASLSLNPLPSTATETSRSTRSLVSKPRAASTRSSASKRMSDLTAVETVANSRVRRANRGA